MPVVDVELVCEAEAEFAAVSAQALADALGGAFGSPAGRTWVRARWLSRSAYAENQAALAPSELPVFVIVMHAHPPAGDALAAEVVAVTTTVAACLGRPPERVHVQYAPAAAGRQAFGGRLVG